MVKKLNGLLMVLLLLCIKVAGQDPLFSQFYASGLYLNPSFAGTEPGWTLNLNHRSQWRSISTEPFITSQASFIYPFYSQKGTGRHWGGVGVSVFNDLAGSGDMRTTGAGLTFAYNVQIARMQDLIFAVQVGAMQKAINTGNYMWGSQYDPYIGFNPGLDHQVVGGLHSSVVIPDVGGSFMYYFNSGRDYTIRGFSGYIGGAAFHLNRPNEALIMDHESRLPLLMKVNAGVELQLSSKLNVSPNMIYAAQNKISQLNIGSYLTYHLKEQGNGMNPTDLIIGGWYRLGDAGIALLGFGNKRYTIGFSYDINTSSLRYHTNGRGAYEISLKLTDPSSKGQKRYFSPRI